VKVVVATPYYPPHVGGAERYCREICVGLRRRYGWDVVVGTTAVGASAGIAEDEGIVVHRMAVSAVLSNTPVSMSWYRRLKTLVRDEDPDLVVAHSPVPFMADVAGRAVGDRPFVLTYHAGRLAKGRPVFDLAATAYERVGLPWLLRRASAVIHYSPDFARLNARLLQGKEYVVPPGVKLTDFSPSAAGSSSPSVLYVGRMERSSRWKGVRHVIDAAPRVLRSVPELTVDLVGSGDDVPSLKRYVRSKGLERVVHFHDALGAPELAERYRRAGVVVLASTASAESFGMALLEAGACGRPVVASRVGGVPNAVVDGETGLLVPPGDVDALADALTAVLVDDDLARFLGRRAEERARAEFAWESRVDATREILEGVAR
jgi:glycosyltransferase involved in cell wall biosynthesis